MYCTYTLYGFQQVTSGRSDGPDVCCQVWRLQRRARGDHSHTSTGRVGRAGQQGQETIPAAKIVMSDFARQVKRSWKRWKLVNPHSLSDLLKLLVRSGPDYWVSECTNKTQVYSCSSYRSSPEISLEAHTVRQILSCLIKRTDADLTSAQQPSPGTITSVNCACSFSPEIFALLVTRVF